MHLKTEQCMWIFVLHIWLKYEIFFWNIQCFPGVIEVVRLAEITSGNKMKVCFQNKYFISVWDSPYIFTGNENGLRYEYCLKHVTAHISKYSMQSIHKSTTSTWNYFDSIKKTDKIQTYCCNHVCVDFSATVFCYWSW